jgi:hypothetical protein
LEEASGQRASIASNCRNLQKDLLSDTLVVKDSCGKTKE